MKSRITHSADPAPIACKNWQAEATTGPVETKVWRENLLTQLEEKK